MLVRIYKVLFEILVHLLKVDTENALTWPVWRLCYKLYVTVVAAALVVAFV